MKRAKSKKSTQNVYRPHTNVRKIVGKNKLGKRKATKNSGMQIIIFKTIPSMAISFWLDMAFLEECRDISNSKWPIGRMSVCLFILHAVCGADSNAIQTHTPTPFTASYIEDCMVSTILWYMRINLHTLVNARTVQRAQNHPSSRISVSHVN